MLWRFWVFDCRAQIEILEDSRKQRLRGLQIEADCQEVHHREQQSRLGCGEGNDGADADRVSVQDQITGAKINHRRNCRHKNLNRCEKGLTTHGLSNLQRNLVFVFVFIALNFAGLTAEALG